VPLVHKRRLAGLLAFSPPRGGVYGYGVVHSLADAAPQLALALENAALVAERALRERLAALGQLAAVIVHDQAADRVLLLQRGARSKFAPLHWDFPSGKADKGEAVTAAAARELKEETGLTVDPASLRVAGIIHGAWGVEAPNGFLTVVFAARSWQGEPVNAEPRKHAQVAWFPAGQVPAELVPDRREALLGYLRSPSAPVVSTNGF